MQFFCIKEKGSVKLTMRLHALPCVMFYVFRVAAALLPSSVSCPSFACVLPVLCPCPVRGLAGCLAAYFLKVMQKTGAMSLQGCFGRVRTSPSEVFLNFTFPCPSSVTFFAFPL